MALCPHCRGDLVNNTANGVWIVTFSTLTTVADDLDTSTFALSAVLDDNSPCNQSLAQTTGVVSGDRTVFSWTLSSPGTPVAASLEVEHDTLGTLTQTLTISEQEAAA